MGWFCKACQVEVAEGVRACTECGAEKAGWTVIAGKTRTFRVTTRPKLQLLWGEGDQAFAPEADGESSCGEPGASEDVASAGGGAAGGSGGASGDSYGGVALTGADHAVAVPKGTVLALHRDGLLPAPADVLFVRQPAKGGDARLDLAVKFDTRDVVTESHPAEAPPGEGVEFRFLFVFGPDPLPEEVDFEGITLVDVTEESGRGFAPAVRFTGRGKPRELPLEALTEVLLDDPILGILADVACTVRHDDGEEEALRSDADGRVSVPLRGQLVDLTVETAHGVRRRRVFPVRRAPSDPVGAWHRLVNLGYGSGGEPPVEPTELGLAMALQEFQAEVGLPPDGALSGEVADRLERESLAQTAWLEWETPVQGSLAPGDKSRAC